ncbi:MAG TPA: PDZ domain-containing protein, partial [Pyrinomonadaceae bacterium]|nr:PDZ domain-containing protein [Pyrinomonadaceae bacterium]
AGAGANRSAGSFVKEATFTIPGLDGFSQPVSLALPLTAMASSLGQDFDGIIGSDFIEGFVVEVDYQTRTLTLHDKDEFNYSGQGEIVPIKLNGAGHPEIEAEVTPLGGSAVKGKFVVDMGSGLALALYSPFVRQRNLLNGLKTMPALGGRGAGGVVTGRLGRVAELKIGKYTIAQPITFFSEDQSGAFAIDSVLGNIGAQIMARFRVFLDYSRSRLIVEPNARFAEPFDRAFAGFNLLAEGADYRTFRVAQIQPDSPATEANLQQDDVLIAVDDKPASQMTLTTINQLFERAASFKLTVRRKDQTVSLTLTTRRMI